MIRIDDLIKKFGPLTAVNIKELLINQSEIIGIVGNNGAGKTTLLRLLLDLLKPEKGSVLSKGKAVYKSEHWKKYTGSYIDTHFLIEFLKPEEYFEFIAKLYGVSAGLLESKLEALSQFMNGEIMGKKKLIRQLSSGNQHKVGIIGALISDPEVLILDEPFNFLDPGSQIILKETIKNLNSNNEITAIISSHNLNHITDLSTRILLMEKGEIIRDIPNTKNSMQEIEIYFSAQYN
ncbi:MAG: ABC transporter ATP-binding protein [Bacteroidales bacterium]|nr:ABC transporter ATP-binding protein [Bacteroidales bacterium]